MGIGGFIVPGLLVALICYGVIFINPVRVKHSC